MADKLNAVLHIEDDTLTRLKSAQERLEAMNSAADTLEQKFSSALSKANTISQTMGNISFSGTQIDVSKMETGFQSVITAVTNLGSAISSNLGGNSESSRATVTQESLIARLQATWEKAASTYAQITNRIKEYKDIIESMTGLSVKGEVLTPESTEAVQKAAESIKMLEDRLRSLGLAFDETRASNKVTDAIGLDDSSYESAITKLNALKEARKEVMLPGTESSAEKKNQLLTQVDDALTSLQSKLPALKTQAKELKDALKADAASNRLTDALNLPEDTVEQMKTKVAEIKKSVSELNAINNQRTNKGLSTIVDVSTIDYARTAIERLKSEITRVKEYTKADKAHEKLDYALGLDDSSVEGCISKINALEKAIKDMQKAMSSGNLDDGAKNRIQSWMDEASSSIADTQNRLNELAMNEMGENLRKEAGKPIEDFANLRKEADRLEKAIQKLQNMPGGMDKFKKGIDDAKAKVNKMRKTLDAFNAGLNHINKSANFVGNALRYAFPSFILYKALGDLVKIRGEFELAEKSLAILLRDSAKAQEIFGQIQKMAIKSPFQVSEMVAQTKQLAAFRIESDKLIETEKMLGDISAGLGVDMNRLILAYGQVKASTVLKGTELRQFSESGVNMLGGLADRFTELQGRIVTTGDVLTMISKKMVSFEDVDAVLRSQTEAGGTFYKMQEQQAETLQGLISNLRDRMDIAFNEMGKSHDSTIKGMIKILSSLIDNYRTFETIVVAGVFAKALPGAIAVSLKGAKNLLRSLSLLGVAARNLVSGTGALVQRLSRSFTIASPLLSVLTAIAVVGYRIYKQAKELDDSLERIDKEALKNAQELERRYTSLANTVSGSAKSDKEKREAMEELRNEFGNIIPAIQQEGYEINNLTDAYNEHISAIRAYNNEKARQEKLSAISSVANSEMEKFVNKLTKNLKRTDLADGTIISKDVISELMAQVVEEIKKGETDIENMGQSFKKKLAEYYNFDIDDDGLLKINEGVHAISKSFGSETQSWNDLVRDLQKYIKVRDQVFADTRYGQEGQKVANEIDNLKQIYADKLDELTDTVSGVFKDNLPKAKIEARKYIKSIAEEGYTDIGTSQFIPSLFEQIGSADINETQRAALQGKLQNALKGIYVGAGETALEEAFAELNSKDEKIFRMDGSVIQFGVGELAQSENESLVAYKKRLIAILETYKKSLEAFEQGYGAIASSQFKLFLDEESNRLAVAALDFVINNENVLGQIDVGDTKKEASDYKTRLNAFVKEVRDAQKNLEELNEEGDALLMQKLQNMAKNLSIQLPPDLKSGKEIREWIEQIKDKLGSDAYLDIQIELNKEDAARKIADMKETVDALWEDFDLSVTLKDLGISSEQYDSSKILKQLSDEEKKLRDMNTKDSIAQADEIARKRISNNRKVAEDAWREMQQAQIKSMDAAQQAYANMFSSIKKIREDANTSDIQISQSEINTSIQARIAQGYKEIAEAEWDAYKGTEMYVQAFGDLEELSGDVLAVLYRQLHDFSLAGNLDPADAKALAEAMDKLDKAMSNPRDASNYFSLMQSGFKAINEAREKSKNLGDDLDAFSKAAAAQASAYDRLQQAKAAYQKDDNEENKAALTEAENEYADAVNRTSEAFVKYSENAKIALKTIKAVSEDARKIADGFDAVGSTISGAVDLVNDFATAFGLSLGDDAADAIDSFVNGFTLVGSALAFVNTCLTATQALLTVIGGTTATVASLLTPLLVTAAAIGAVTAAIKISDNAKLREIEKQKELVEELTKEYELLESAIESAFSLSTVNESFEEQMRNIEEQREAIEQMIEIEKSRGAKADDDSLDDYNDQLDELIEKEKEANEARLEALGAKADYSDDAKSFASSWREAFEETGDGFDSLTESFDSMFDDVIAQQLNLRVLGPYVEQLQTKLQEILDDGIVTAKESTEFRQAKNSIAQTVNKELADLASSLGVTSSGTVEKDTIQKGIESITESTAQIIEGILNSMRFFVADTNDKAAKIHSILSGEGETANPILGELQIQTGLIRSINSTLAGVVKPNHSKGGTGLKVFVD